MSRIVATACAALAVATGLTAGISTASAAPLVADLAVYRLPTVAGQDCTLGVTNNGPDTVEVLLSPAYPIEKGYYRQLGTLAAGQSTSTSFTSCGGQASYHPDFLYVSGASRDPNPLNNVFLLHL